MLTKQIISAIILLGILLKLIDEHYDINLFSSKFAILLNIIFFSLLIYVFINNSSFLLITFITVIAVILCTGEMQDRNNKNIFSYWLLNFITLIFFIYYYQKGTYDNIFKNFQPWLILTILLYIVVFVLENKLFPEEYSSIKLKFRIFLVFFFILTIIYFHYLNSKFNLIQEMYILVCYFGIGYFGTSILTLLYYQKKLNQ